ncbi:uncharacterized protein BP01DRAFT_39765 [Aspergillus saccharolyticus JOP 1030-1]|uniref:Uncharacterized protein n=1 Tax=Aspergillus saccharolyticus JOP 1030-1 TaxID=1450539 RepID=A0A318ZE41_9EURO|nr:hypothetical protein BP01DRAFT_39765 [Aspergillus saccharolyticus JOP 1030-1]PYH45796.1 hypothetical protein BP01DRAFT_39765 [Aspergillus saccharolyticus JOP 1030-1]
MTMVGGVVGAHDTIPGSMEPNVMLLSNQSTLLTVTDGNARYRLKDRQEQKKKVRTGQTFYRILSCRFHSFPSSSFRVILPALFFFFFRFSGVHLKGGARHPTQQYARLIPSAELELCGISRKVSDPCSPNENNAHVLGRCSLDQFIFSFFLAALMTNNAIATIGPRRCCSFSIAISHQMIA